MALYLASIQMYILQNKDLDMTCTNGHWRSNDDLMIILNIYTESNLSLYFVHRKFFSVTYFSVHSPTIK